jgi:hypothetical protein
MVLESLWKMVVLDMLEQNSQELQQNGNFLLLIVVEIMVAATYLWNY